MLKYWLPGLIVGIVSMLIGYTMGIGRAKVLHRMSLELVEIADQKLNYAKSILLETMNELESEGQEG